MSDYEYATGRQAGWVCPICGRVYAPWVPECTWHEPGKSNIAYSDHATPIRDFMVNPKIDYVHKENVTRPETGDGDYYKHLTNAK